MQRENMDEIRSWKTVEVNQIQELLSPFNRWCLCGGKSIDLLLGRNTREHGDTDIGVFRSDLEECLSAIGKDRVFLCAPPGQHSQWDGTPVPNRVNDIWITSADSKQWVVQVLVFSDDDEFVYYKRNKAMRWSKESHMWHIDDIAILNPLITFLYKTNRKRMEEKDIQDVKVLIEELQQSHALDVATRRR